MKPSFLPPGVANRSLVFWDGRLNTALGRRPAAGPEGGRAVDSLIPFQPTPRGAAPARALRDYGKSSKDSVAKVKALYVELDVKGAFEAYEQKSYEDITGLINQEKVLPHGLFLFLLKKIYRRSK